MTRQTFTMQRGERRLLRAATGSRWRTSRGAVRLIEPPRWLGEHVVQIDTTLRGGQPHRIDAGGWVTLHALADSVVDCELP
ncbi:MAG: hypothetical protein H7Y61_03640, partial [Rhizobiales bacterium]|nr:hypothetical protein [Rhizobacter sp.]